MKIVKSLSLLTISVMVMGLASCNKIKNYRESNTPNISSETESTEMSEGSDGMNSAESKLNREEKINEIKKQPDLQGYIAQYRFTDKKGDVYDIFVTKEEAGIIVDSYGNINYSKYDNYTYNSTQKFTPANDSNLTIEFEGGPYERGYNNYIYGLVIDGNWVYHGEHEREKHPKWRLPIEKISGKDNTAKANGDSSSKKHSTETTEDAEKKSKKELSEEELVALETITYGYNEAAWRAKARKDARKR